MGDTITKGKIGRQDMNKWGGGSAKTFTRVTDAGGTVTLTTVGDFVDVLAVYGDGDTYTSGTLQSAIDALGTANTAGLLIAPGTWTVSADLTFPSNLTLIFADGASFSVASGKTVTINGYVWSIPRQIFSGSGTVTVAGYPQNDGWWGNTEAVILGDGGIGTVKILTDGLVTTTGDILYFDGTNITRLAIGSTDQVLTVSGGLPAWVGTTTIAYRLLSEQSSAPSTAANQGAIYTKDVGGETHLFYRRESDGSEIDLLVLAARFISGGDDEIDGDKLDIDWNPDNSTPDSSPAEVSSPDHLTAHLKGIDNKFAALPYPPRRQTVLAGSVDSDGLADFLSESAPNVLTLDGTTTDVVMAFANGYDSNGQPDDTIHVQDADLELDLTGAGLAATENYIILAKYSAGVVTLGYLDEDNWDGYRYAPDASPSANDCYFNIPAMKFYEYSGSAWVQKDWLAVGEILTDGSGNVDTTTTYAICGRSIITGQTFSGDTANSVNHNLGCIPERVTIRGTYTAASNNWATGDIVDISTNDSDSSDRSRQLLLTRLIAALYLGAGLTIIDKSTFNASTIDYAKITFSVICDRGW